ncbi:MAG TPA: hypothetical protein ENI66_02025 [Candidatus Yonathbacteria bacterium]|mgnify:CR=1 FL=1|nr:hypothetical protein [Candidatus Yonathbacteria bacterium]
MIHKTRLAGVAFSQAQRVKDFCRGVILVDSKREPIEWFINPNYQIGTIAVVGPANIDGHCVDQVVLLEIGTNRSYPYKRSEGYAHNGTKTYRKVFNERKNFVCLSSVELSRFWDALEDILVEISKDSIRYYKCKNRKIGNTVLPRSMRFSVSFDDVACFAAILRADCLNSPRKYDTYEDMRRLAVWSTDKLIECDYLEFAETQKFLRELNRHKSNLSQLDYLLEQKRVYLFPHHYYLLLNYSKGRIGFGVLKRLLLMVGINMEVVDEWGKLFEACNSPVFSKDVYIRLTPLERDTLPAYSNGRRKPKNRFGFPRDSLSFEFASLNMDNPLLEQFVCIHKMYKCDDSDFIPF